MPLQAAYTAFGLSIQSDFLLPEFSAANGGQPADVTIRAGTIEKQTQIDRKTPRRAGARRQAGVPAPQQNCARRERFFVVAPGPQGHRDRADEFLLEMEGIARYRVSAGTEITGEALPGADDDSVRLFLTGSVFGALLHQRGLLPLHASAIETPKGAVIFAGGSGKGKSALAAAFYARGYRVLADEICLADPICPPAFPRLMLWPDILDQTGLWNPNVRPVRPNLKKFHVPLEKGFASEPSPVSTVYLLSANNTAESLLAPVSGFNKVANLAEVIYQRRFCAETKYFHRLTTLARNRIMRLDRSASATLKETADLLERDFCR
jgi:hypothetical protein